MVEVLHFEREFQRFSGSIYRCFNDGPFISFRNGAARGWEGYKPLLRDRALAALGATSWTEAEIGTGSILDQAVDAIELPGNDQTRNNLVSWEGRYGPGSASHAALLTSRTGLTRRRTVEQIL